MANPWTPDRGHSDPTGIHRSREIPPWLVLSCDLTAQRSTCWWRSWLIVQFLRLLRAQIPFFSSKPVRPWGELAYHFRACHLTKANTRVSLQLFLTRLSNRCTVRDLGNQHEPPDWLGLRCDGSARKQIFVSPHEACLT